MPQKLLINIIFISVLFTANLLSQTNQRKNFQLLDSLIQVESAKIADECSSKKIRSVIINFSEHPALWLVKQHFYIAFEKKDIKIITGIQQETIELNINIQQLEIQYVPDENENDTLIRYAVLALDGNLKNNNQIEIVKEDSLAFNDKI